MDRPLSESYAQIASPAHRHSLDADAPPFTPATGHAVQRPVSEFHVDTLPQSAEASAMDRYVDELSQYEDIIDQMAKASLDQNFKDELSAIEQWFQVLSDAERTATLYSLLQHTSRVQQGFFVAWLQQGMRKEQRGRGD